MSNFRSVMEYLSTDYFYGIDGELLYEIRSEFQNIQVLENNTFGKMLRIDGALQCSENDESYYHEPLVHMVMARTVSEPTVLVVGGGDGGASEEVLKWKNVKKVDQVEIDREVINTCRLYFSSINKGLLNENQDVDHRFNLHIDDGKKYIENLKKNSIKIDALILDLTDPGGPSIMLWDEPFFKICSDVLGIEGILGLHIGAPWAQNERCKLILARLRSQFADVMPFITNIPISGGAWMMATAANTNSRPIPSKETLQSMLSGLQGENLKVVDARILHAMVDMAYQF